MILDHLNNIHHYTHLEEIYACLKHLISIDEDIELGKYEISKSSRLIVSEYATTKIGLGKFEAHKTLIDIQYPIKGLERIKWSPLNGMKTISQYDIHSDTTFYSDPICDNQSIIGNGIFAIFFPEDAHLPQLSVDEDEHIKKITIKVTVEH